MSLCQVYLSVISWRVWVFLFVLVGVGCTPGQAQRSLGIASSTSGGALQPEQAAYDITSYDLALTIDPEARTIDGALIAYATIVHPVRWFVLDLDTALTVHQVVEDAVDRPVERRAGGQVWIDLERTRQPGETVQVRVAYGGAPRVAPQPPWVGGFTWAATASGDPWIATSNQMDGADLWWPVKDHPSDEADSMHLRITVPDPLVVATNGVLQSVTPVGGGQRQHHWRVSNPINNYGVALNIAPYETIEAPFTSITGETFPVTFWVLPERLEAGQKQFPQFLDHMRFFEELLGPYPFRSEKYGIAHTPHLGMEHQTIIAYGDDFDNDPRGYDWLHHHELGHEWWGNLVTVADWKDFWIHEGFCTYTQALYAEHLFGTSGYQEEVMTFRNSLNNEKPLAPRTTQTTRDMYFANQDAGRTDSDIYYKGALVLHTLRFVMGDEPFRTFLRRMAYPTPEWEQRTDGSQTRFVTTHDVQRMAEEVHGAPLDWFFEVYTRQPYLPELRVEREEGHLVLAWDVPEGLSFPMPVEVQLGDKQVRLDMHQGQGRTVIPEGVEPVIDPDNWLLRVQ